MRNKRYTVKTNDITAYIGRDHNYHYNVPM